MGREVRRVPPNWEHPLQSDNNPEAGPKPLYDQHVVEALEEWLVDFDRIRAGNLKDDFEREYYTGIKGLIEWLQDNPGPDPDTCRPYRTSEGTWYQAYETVSEGTPVSPPFETQDELVEYLVNNGDFWDQRRYRDGDGPKPGYSEDAARAFVNDCWAPSFVMKIGPDGTEVKSGVEALGDKS